MIMDLPQIMRIGYGIVIGIFILMMWISMIETKETESVQYPPCFFNSLCSCSKSIPDLGIVRCQNVHLPRIPETVNISKVFMLHLENNQLRTIDPFFLQSTGLYKIVISRNPLSTIPDEALIGLERSLWEIEMSHCDLTVVPNRAIRYLQKLRRLDLTGNDISNISPENWRGIESSLQTLILADNYISFIPTDSFSSMMNLETIDLSGNNLREIDSSVFRDGMGKLANLLLGDNQLTAIPYQALQPLRILKTLDLSYNVINKMEPATEPGVDINLNYQLSLDELRLDYNQLNILLPVSFKYFNVLNKTYLDGNRLFSIEENAFRQASIKELYLRNCGLTEMSPSAFDGLENSLETLDLSGNNISFLPHVVLSRFGSLRTLSLSDNALPNLDATEIFSGFLNSLYKLDLSGIDNGPINLQDIRRLRNLRTLSLSRLSQPSITPEDFLGFGIDLEGLQITFAKLQIIKNNAFKYVHALKSIDLSENNIDTIENHAFADIGHSLTHLKLSHALSSSFSNVPIDAISVLSNIKELDLSNNRLKIMPETSFHFLRNLRKLELQDNIIEIIHKGTFQGDIHTELMEIHLSFNNIRSITQHSFVNLPNLEQLNLDDNSIESLERRSFMNLEQIKRLNLRGNKISIVPFETFQNLPQLEDLDISYNQLRSFDFGMFDQVGTLSIFSVNISHNNLGDLLVNLPIASESAGINGIHSSIKSLDLSFNNITSISKQFFRPVELSLTHLYLSHNNIMNATKDVFGNMRHLQLLDISYNGMYELDFDMFRNTKKVQVLRASHNNIADVPNDLFRFLTNLRIVDLSHNRLRSLSDNLFREEGLERLDISHNFLSKLPLSSMTVATAMTLCELDLSWNSISSLSHGGLITRFKRLMYLDLSYNRLAQIDAGVFRALPRLSSLDLSHNSQLALEPNGLSFQGLEYSLLHLKLNNVSLTMVPTLPTPNLVSLSLSHNFLPSVPPEMATNMTNLRRLDLDFNDLTAVPIVTHSLVKLRYLSMVANSITYLSNTSLLGVADHIVELDIRKMDLTNLEAGAFCKMFSLKLLRLNYYENLKNFNIPTLLQYNIGLKELDLNIDAPTDNDLNKVMAGIFPPKLKTLTFTGIGLKTLGTNILQGVRSPVLFFGIHNTSILRVPTDVFVNLEYASNLTIDIRGNSIQTFQNPSRGLKPNLHKKTFLMDVKISGNKLICDCDLGWIEVWLRKRRQYVCGDSPSASSSFNEHEYECRHVNDDMRTAICQNKNNDSVIDVLKSEIECGWSSSKTLSPSEKLIITILLMCIYFL
ncbi:unnamed protein product [Phaedon cochleariae]|uniref:Chaoptin n=1 Tax=Phaedon cochleariae TaxID=80249 RepID=A0A9P0GXB1_PHACE|nr:unnamed protein product [Phaedon cochleariae]